MGRVIRLALFAGALYALLFRRDAVLALLYRMPSGVQTRLVDTTHDDCDSSYPTVCIPSPPPRLRCADVNARAFTVLPPDPHHLDPDHDGIGCKE